VYTDGVEPEVKTGMLMAQSHVPQQQIYSTVGQEKLQHIIEVS
jgi:hypothetical protein